MSKTILDLNGYVDLARELTLLGDYEKALMKYNTALSIISFRKSEVRDKSLKDKWSEVENVIQNEISLCNEIVQEARNFQNDDESRVEQAREKIRQAQENQKAKSQKKEDKKAPAQEKKQPAPSPAPAQQPKKRTLKDSYLENNPLHQEIMTNLGISRLGVEINSQKNQLKEEELKVNHQLVNKLQKMIKLQEKVHSFYLNIPMVKVQILN